jgi:hypothetical protein
VLLHKSYLHVQSLKFKPLLFIYAESYFSFFWFGLAMELALSLEKLVNEKLLNLHSVMPLSLYFWIEYSFSHAINMSSIYPY